VLADRAAAAAAVAARASQPGALALAERPAGPATVRDLASLTSLVRQRPLQLRAYPEGEPVAEPEFEPWNPEATYTSLVRILTELKAMNPDEVAVLPSKPSRLRGVRINGRLVAGGLVAALAVGGVGAFVLTHSSANGAGRTAAAGPPHTTTSLVAIESGNQLQGAMLLSRTGNKTQEILVPSRLLVDVPGQGSVELGQAPISGPDAAASAVSNALHVRVDGTWVLDTTAISALVDAEGGVDVTLTDDVLPSDGSSGVALGVGTSHITGAQAAQLALAIGAQEPEASRLARQQILLEAMLTKLPSTQAQITPLVQNAVLAGAETPARLSALLAGVRSDVAGARASSTLVPTIEIDSGSGTPWYGLDDKAATAMVAERLTGAQFPVPPGGRARILVQNGIGTPGLGDAVRNILVPRGYIFRSGGNAPSFGSGPSVVLIPDSSPKSRQFGSTVAKLLGLPDSSVQLDLNQTTIADVVVILGSDYKAPVAPTPTVGTAGS
jgi:cell envelope-related transcriptional attenuator-like protein/LytR cell envelope-related transcriptional attenuator